MSCSLSDTQTDVRLPKIKTWHLDDMSCNISGHSTKIHAIFITIRLNIDFRESAGLDPATPSFRHDSPRPLLPCQQGKRDPRYSGMDRGRQQRTLSVDPWCDRGGQVNIFSAAVRRDRKGRHAWILCLFFLEALPGVRKTLSG